MTRIKPDSYIISWKENGQMYYLPPEIMPQLEFMPRIIERDGNSKVVCIWLIKWK
jgi:hypothetical protein